MTRVAILNSHQSKTPVGADLWVRQTLAAVAYAATQQWTVISSVGMNTWELVTWAAGVHNCRVELILPFDSDTNQVLNDFSLDDARVTVKKLVFAEQKRGGKSWYEGRDQFIVNNADILLPVAIRSGGRLQHRLDEGNTGNRIDRRFEIGYAPAAHHARAPVDTSSLSEEIQNWEGEYLIHWTRACHSAWPGEKPARYYRDLAESSATYCRSALASLQRIIGEQTLRASSWRIAGDTSLVALSSAAPLAALPLMRWRARWARWSFEPYGIAIRRDAAIALGARAVRYVSESEWNEIPPDEKPYCHRRGESEDIWTAEAEWRIRGDLNLNALPAEAVRVIVRHRGEVDVIRRCTTSEVFCFESHSSR